MFHFIFISDLAALTTWKRTPTFICVDLFSETILWPAILKREFTVSYTSKIKMGCTRTSERQARD